MHKRLSVSGDNATISKHLFLKKKQHLKLHIFRKIFMIKNLVEIKKMSVDAVKLSLLVS